MKASLTELRVFVALAESGHFTRAAEKLGMSQSSLSAALVKLEKQLGTRLFDRHTRACRVNEAGAALLPAARRLVADWDHLFADARDFARFSRGSVTVAAPNAQCALVLPPVIRVFRDTHPGVRVVLHDVPEHEVHALVRSGAADLGIATQTDGRSDLVSTAMSADEFIVVLPPGHPLDLSVTATDFHGFRQKLHLHSPAGASAFFERHGYSNAGKEKSCFGLDSDLMWKRLDGACDNGARKRFCHCSE